MATLLFVIISIIFIGVGLPDSLFGAAWPAIYSEFSLPISYANFVTILISSGTVLASFFSAKLINKFGTGWVSAVSTALTALSLLGFSLSNSIWWFCILSLPLGAGAGAIDAALNNFVAVHYSAMKMNFMHCFYGIGVAISPLVMSFALGQNNNWRLGYQIVFIVQLIITAIAFVSIPLWNKKSDAKSTEDEQPPVTLTFRQMAKIPAVRTAWVLFCASVALEFICGIWGCSYLVGAEGLSESQAALIQTLYYVGITTGRFVSGFVSAKLTPKRTVYIGYCTVGVAISLLFAPLPAIVKGVALFLVGFGNGPTFPNLTHMTPVHFGKDLSQSIISSQMTACNLGILIMPPVFGILADKISVSLFPVALLVMYLIMVFSNLIFDKLPKPKSKDLNLN
jgi:fucose permease